MGELRPEMHQIVIFAVPAALVLLELFAGAEPFADADYTGKNALWRDLQIGSLRESPLAFSFSYYYVTNLSHRVGAIV